ncbi:MAG: sel1 repeat family protein [Clostridiales bacterium]|nr:sel1 repeat family protein [Clostridiales bacterium]
MDKIQARKIVERFYRKANPSEDDQFVYTEALGFLIEEEKRPSDMMELGGYYYELRNFDLALKYYEMAAAYDYDVAWECLGYIWYYGRTGEKDYKKAFEYFSKCMKKGNIVASYKIADMYKNGYYVEKDESKYEAIIESLYPKVKHVTNLGAPVPEIFTRLAKIRVKQGKKKEAIDLYLGAKDFLAQRISYNAFFGNLNIMNWLVNDLYVLIEFDPMDFDFFDLYYVLKKPCEVIFYYEQNEYSIKAQMEADECVIQFGENWYRNVSDFMSKAMIKGIPLTKINGMLYGFEVE